MYDILALDQNSLCGRLPTWKVLAIGRGDLLAANLSFLSSFGCGGTTPAMAPKAFPPPPRAWVSRGPGGAAPARLIPADVLNKPEVRRLTAEEQVVLAGIMGVPESRAHLLERNVALSMPNLPWFHNWVHYVEDLDTRGRLPAHARFGVMIEELGEWRRVHGDDALRSTIDSIVNFGYPLQVWTFVHNMLDDPPDGERAVAPTDAEVRARHAAFRG